MIGKNHYNYHSIEEIRELPNNRLSPGEERIARLFLRLSDTIEVQEVGLIGILDLLSMFGGLITSLLELSFIVFFIAEDAFIASVVHKMFTFRAYETGVRPSEQENFVKKQI